ncbi:MAG TPA: hypothetical protein V6D22_12735 [Candidatus Obscuribacterales bacterium]
MTATADVDVKSNKPDVAPVKTDHEQGAAAGEKNLADHAHDLLNKRPGESTLAGVGDQHAGDPQHSDAVRTAGDSIWSNAATKASFEQMKGKESGNEQLPACSLEATDKGKVQPGQDKGDPKHGHEFNIPGADGQNQLHVDRQGDSMTITRNGEKYELNKKEGTHEFTDNKGNNMEMGPDGKLHAKVDGEQYTISRDEIRQQLRGGNGTEVVHKHDGDGDDPSKSQKDQIVTKPGETGDRKVAISDNTDQVRITAEQDGSRTFHVHKPGSADDSETVKYDTKNGTLSIDRHDGHDPTVLKGDAQNKQWINPATNKPFTDAELAGMTINGQPITQGQDIQISGTGQTDGRPDGTTIKLDGSIQTTVNGNQVTIKGAETDGSGNPEQKVTALMQKADGSTTEITTTGQGATTTDCGTNGACTVSSINGQGQLDAGQGITNPDGTIAKNPDGTPVMQSSDFRFNPGDGSQPATAQLGSADQPEATFSMAPAGTNGSDGWQFQQANIGDLGLTNGSMDDPNAQWQMSFNDGWSANNDWSSWSDPNGQTAYNWDSSTGDYSSFSSDYGYDTASNGSGSDYDYSGYTADATGPGYTDDAVVAATDEMAVSADAPELVASASDGVPDNQGVVEQERASLAVLLASLPTNSRFDNIRASVAASLDKAGGAIAAADAQKDRLAMAKQAAMDGGSDSDVLARSTGLDSSTVAQIRQNETNNPEKKREQQQLMTA